MDKKDPMRIVDLLLISIFLSAIYLPLLGTEFRVNETKSSVEKRTLAVMPSLPRKWDSLSQFTDSFESFFQDNFGCRTYLTYLYNALKFKLGDSPSERVILGKDGWLFYNGDKYTDPVGDYRNVHHISKDLLSVFVQDLVAKRNWLKNRGVEYLLVIVPNKHTIYPEYLPNSMKKVSAISLLDQLLEYVQEKSAVMVVDLRDPLYGHKKEQQLYYRTDTHWNQFGANIAQYEIARVLGLLFPDKIKPVLYNRKDFQLQERAGGDLANFIGLREWFEEEEPVFMLKNPCKLTTVPPVHHNRETFTTTCDSGVLTTLVFRDSFFTKIQPFFSQYFNSATFIWDKIHMNQLEQFVVSSQPDVVIEEWAERALPTRIKEVSTQRSP